jgi:hypothetical protein
MPAGKPTPAFLATLAVLFSLAVGAPAANAADARYEGASADGSIVFFSTDEQPLLLGDTDLRTDVYMRSFDDAPGIEDFVTRKVSTGPAGGNNAFDAFFAGASEDGKRIFFSTKESLVAADADHATDLYLRDLTEPATTTLVSGADPSCSTPECGSAELNANFVLRGVLADGSKAFFMTSEALSEEDEDKVADVYLRDIDAGTTTLVSQGDPSCQPQDCGNGPVPVLSFEDASDDGSLVVFRSEEGLANGDDDGDQPDLYQWDLDEGTTALVSTEGDCPEVSCVPTYGGSSPDGSHVIFETRDRIDAGDTDSSQDVYDWTSGTASRVSFGPGGGNNAKAATFPGAVSGFPGISVDGARVFFETDEQLVGADEDGANDVYERSGGATALVSRRDPSCEPAGCGDDELAASFRWISPDGSGPAVVFGTAEPLNDADEDEAQDVYARDGGTTTLLSVGPLGGNDDENANFAGASHDGSHVFFITAEPLVALDGDESSDIYDGFAGSASLVSTGPVGGNGVFSSGLTGVSENGEFAFLATDERLAVDDKDGEERDVYQRSVSGTLLVSTGNAVALGPPPPTQLNTDPPSPASSTSPRILGDAEAGSAIQVYTNGACTGEPVKSGSAEQLSGAGIQVGVESGSTTSFWLTAEAEGITSSCAGPVTYEHSGGSSSSPGGKQGGGTGSGTAGSGGPDSVDVAPAYVAPRTRITFAPAAKTRARRPVFRFTDATGQPGTSFRCRVDRARWRGCSSPVKVKRLPRGRHVFQVKGVNAVGAVEAKPVKRPFKVVAG